MKHVGKMKNNSARVAVAYRTLPGDPEHCLIIGTQGLGDSYHDTLMTVLESDSGQQANELAEVLAARRFPDGNNMLGYLHTNGHLVKVKTSMVNMTPDSQTMISLDDLNNVIAGQRGVSVDELAITDGSMKSMTKKKTPPVEETSQGLELTADELRARADALYEQVVQLRKQADSLSPPKKKSNTKTKTVKVSVE